MDYVYQIYTMVFGNGAQAAGAANGPRKIVAFGNVLIDRIAQLTDTDLLEKYQIPLNSKGELDAETLSKITADACERFGCSAYPGGSALNTVRILKKIGGDGTFFGAIGEDNSASELKNMLQDIEIDARFQIIKDHPTGQCICLVYNDRTALYANIGAAAKFSTDFLKKAENDESLVFLRPIERKQILYIEGFFIPQREDVCDFIVLHYIRERRRFAFNLSAPYIVEENYGQVLKLAKKAFFLFGNEAEYNALCQKMDCKSLEKMADVLSEKGSLVKVIVVTKGAAGVQVISNFVDDNAGPGPTKFQSFHVPRVENLVDTTGAGDAFVAGFLQAWLEKRSISECVRMATDIAGLVVTQVGCNLPADYVRR